MRSVRRKTPLLQSTGEKAEQGKVRQALSLGIGSNASENPPRLFLNRKVPRLLLL
jgi:hypothetical protein